MWSQAILRLRSGQALLALAPLPRADLRNPKVRSGMRHPHLGQFRHPELREGRERRPKLMAKALQGGNSGRRLYFWRHNAPYRAECAKVPDFAFPKPEPQISLKDRWRTRQGR